MAESTEFRERVAAAPAEIPPARTNAGAWSKFKLIIRRTFFWSYERGSWQYDLIVAAIVAFIFLTPRAWFRHDPNLGMVDLRHVQGVVEVAHEKARHTYMMDARLVQSRAPATPEAAAGAILGERLGKPYRVLSVEPVRDKEGVTLSYKVVAEE